MMMMMLFHRIRCLILNLVILKDTNQGHYGLIGNKADTGHEVSLARTWPTKQYARQLAFLVTGNSRDGKYAS
jgi:hypothetical protein